MMNRLENAARQALEALEHSHANEPIWKTPHRDAAAALREALAEQASALAKQQAFVDSLPAGDDKMFEQIHLWAMQSYKRHRGSTAGQQITAADSFDTHIIWAALRWAGEHQAPTQQAAKPSSVLVEGFGRVAMRKLNDLREKGYAINGVSIATISEAGETNRGAVTTGGMVLWWPQQPAQQPLSPTTGMNMAQRILHVGGRNNAAGYVEFGSIQAVEALVRQVLRDLPTQQPLTDEQKAVLRECLKKAMKWADQAGIPECAAFGEVAQDLDWLCGQLGITGSKT